jgi:hypothetical protein
MNVSKKLLPIVAVLLALASIAVSPSAFECGRGIATLLDEDIDKQFMSEDPNHYVPITARLGAYVRAIPAFLIFVAPLFIAAGAPFVFALLFARRLVQPSRSYRPPGWILFSFCVLVSGVLIFAGIAPSPYRLACLVLAALLIFAAFYPSLPRPQHESTGNA